MTKIVFLDRDGVLNRCLTGDGAVPVPPHSVDELELLPRVADACRLLQESGFRLIVVTNQPDVARGRVERSVVEEMNERLLAELPLDRVRVCWHDDADACHCRKPSPGLLLDSMRELGADAGACVMVGDRWRDVEAGRRAGCRTALVGDGYGEAFPSQPDLRVESLWEAALAVTEEGDS